MVHNFKDSKKVGDMGEQLLDNYFSDKFIIEDVNMDQQRLGWDRVFTHKDSGTRASVEYKTDTRATDTGNIFMEVWSNKEAGKKGWAYTSTAQWLYYFMTGSMSVFIVDVPHLKLYLKVWEKQLKIKQARNKTYTSEGMLVPIEIFKTVAYEEVYIG